MTVSVEHAFCLLVPRFEPSLAVLSHNGVSNHGLKGCSFTSRSNLAEVLTDSTADGACVRAPSAVNRSL